MSATSLARRTYISYDASLPIYYTQTIGRYVNITIHCDGILGTLAPFEEIKCGSFQCNIFRSGNLFWGGGLPPQKTKTKQENRPPRSCDC